MQDSTEDLILALKEGAVVAAEHLVGRAVSAVVSWQNGRKTACTGIVAGFNADRSEVYIDTFMGCVSASAQTLEAEEI